MVTPNHPRRCDSKVPKKIQWRVRTAAPKTRRLACDAVLITRGVEDGLFEKDNDPVMLKRRRASFDVTEPEIVIATLAAALVGGGSLIEAALLANYAAGIVVGKLGTATATMDEVLDSIGS